MTISDWLSRKFLHLRLILSGRTSSTLSCMPIHEASYMMRSRIAASMPFCAGKLGTTERAFLLAYLYPGWNSSRVQFDMLDNFDPRQIGRYPSGIYPHNRSTIEWCMREICASLKELDLLAHWSLIDEQFICMSLGVRPFVTDSISVFNVWECLDRGLSLDSIWLSGCRGKTVLMVTPFQESIQRALDKHSSFFASVFGASSLHFLAPPRQFDNLEKDIDYTANNWINTLTLLRQKLESIDFDVCLVGAGAYSLPLCAHARRIMKKPAIHLGGDLHHNFGITGGRWSGSKYPRIQEKYLGAKPCLIVDCEKPVAQIAGLIHKADHYW